MVELLSRDNVALREKLESVYLKMNSMQMVRKEMICFTIRNCVCVPHCWPNNQIKDVKTKSLWSQYNPSLLFISGVNKKAKVLGTWLLRWTWGRNCVGFLNFQPINEAKLARATDRHVTTWKTRDYLKDVATQNNSVFYWSSRYSENRLTKRCLEPLNYKLGLRSFLLFIAGWIRVREHARCVRRATNIVHRTRKSGMRHENTNGCGDGEASRKQQKSKRWDCVGF